MKNPLFYAKILLFGEYGVIENGKVLTLPYDLYKGKIKFSKKNKESIIDSKKSLHALYEYLKNIKFPKKFAIDLIQLKKDLSEGMYFDSNIPQGYGVGSSGALVAALFNRYSIYNISPNKIKKNDLIKLKILFGKIESFFHGKSSGIDPLICFMHIPLIIHSKTHIDTIGVKENQLGKSVIFLLDSGIISKTAPMINLFFEKLKNDGFRSILKEEFIKYSNACINAFIKKDLYPFFSNLKKLSIWAFEHLQPMIPNNIINLWKKGIETDVFYLKLCGSGGGGFILGFSQDYSQAEDILKNFNKVIIHRF